GIRDPLVTGVQTCALPISRISTVSVLVEPEVTPAVSLVNVRWSAAPTVTEKLELSLVRPVLEAVIVIGPAVWPVTTRLATPPERSEERRGGEGGESEAAGE